MDKQKHKKLKKVLAEAFGRNGINSVLSSVLVLTGIAVFTSGSVMPAVSEYQKIIQLTAMIGGMIVLFIGFVYMKLAYISEKVSDSKTSLNTKIICGALAAINYSFAVAILLQA